MSSERPTPLTDAVYAKCNDPDVYLYQSAIQHMRDLARRLERVAAELADALEAKAIMANFDKPRKLEDALSWRENDELAERMAQNAMRHYEELKGGRVSMEKERKGEGCRT